MALEVLNGIGYGGPEGQRLNRILQQLQSRKTEVLAGAAATTQINVTGMEDDSQIESVIRYVTGTPSDITAEAVPVNRRAKGTLTLTGIVAGDRVSVDGVEYTAVANSGAPAQSGQLAPRQFAVGGSNNATAANLAKAINAYSNNVTATVATNVVTVTAVAKGTGGNAIALDVTNSGGHATRSAATLAGGVNTGGFTLSTTNTTGNQLVVTWMKKYASAV